MIDDSFHQTYRGEQCYLREQYPHSQTSINRRVNRVAEEARGVDDDALYPHALRATSACYWAARGLEEHALTNLMGWADLSTSENYIASSSDRTAQAMRQANR